MTVWLVRHRVSLRGWDFEHLLRRQVVRATQLLVVSTNNRATRSWRGTGNSKADTGDMDKFGMNAGHPYSHFASPVVARCLFGNEREHTGHAANKGEVTRDCVSN